MKPEIIIKDNYYAVAPAEPTWNGRLSLSELDQTSAINHISVIYFYRPPPTDNDTILNSLLVSSLSKSLVYYYPLAGRLHWLPGGRLELHCNATGARLRLAKTQAEMHEFLSDVDNYTAYSKYNEFLSPSSINYAKTSIEDIPVLLVQVTRFRCGGVSIGVTVSHALIDGISLFTFLGDWARLARAEPMKQIPLFDKKKGLRAGEPPSASSPKFHHLEYFKGPPLLIGPEDSIEIERKREVVFSFFELSKNEVAMLRDEANDNQRQSENGRRYSRYEAIAGHIWRCLCKARGHKTDQPTTASICIDIRRKIQPPLPGNYFGCAVVDAIATGRSGDIVSSPLSWTARKIREAIESVTSDYVNTVIEVFKNQPDLSEFQDMHKQRFFGNPNVVITSWIGLPLCGLDFGWGKEVCMLPAGTQNYGDGEIFIIPGGGGGGSSDGEGVEENGCMLIAVCLQAIHMVAFKKFLYQKEDEDMTRQ